MMTKAEYENFLKELNAKTAKAKMKLMTEIKNSVDKIVDKEFDDLKKEVEKIMEK